MIDNPGSYPCTCFFYAIVIFWFGLNIQTLINCSYFTEFKDDPEIYVFPDLKYVGIELWQVMSVLFYFILLFFISLFNSKAS